MPPSVILQVARSLRDVPSLGLLVPADQKQDQPVSLQGVVDAIPRSVVGPVNRSPASPLSMFTWMLRHPLMKSSVYTGLPPGTGGLEIRYNFGRKTYGNGHFRLFRLGASRFANYLGGGKECRTTLSTVFAVHEHCPARVMSASLSRQPVQLPSAFCRPAGRNDAGSSR